MTSANRLIIPPVVFVSYSHRDNPLLDRLLKKMGPFLKDGVVSSIVWDKDFVAGMDWTEQTNEAIDRADIIIAVVTPNYLASPNCMNEVDYADSIQSMRNRAIIPLIFENCDWKATALGKYHSIPAHSDRQIGLQTNNNRAWGKYLSELLETISKIGEQKYQAALQTPINGVYVAPNARNVDKRGLERKSKIEETMELYASEILIYRLLRDTVFLPFILIYRLVKLILSWASGFEFHRLAFYLVGAALCAIAGVILLAGQPYSPPSKLQGDESRDQVPIAVPQSFDIISLATPASRATVDLYIAAPWNDLGFHKSTNNTKVLLSAAAEACHMKCQPALLSTSPGVSGMVENHLEHIRKGGSHPLFITPSNQSLRFLRAKLGHAKVLFLGNESEVLPEFRGTIPFSGMGIPEELALFHSLVGTHGLEDKLTGDVIVVRTSDYDDRSLLYFREIEHRQPRGLRLVLRDEFYKLGGPPADVVIFDAIRPEDVRALRAPVTKENAVLISMSPDTNATARAAAKKLPGSVVFHMIGRDNINNRNLAQQLLDGQECNISCWIDWHIAEFASALVSNGGRMEFSLDSAAPQLERFLAMKTTGTNSTLVELPGK